MPNCIYCNSEVIEDEPGWGLTLDGEVPCFWHSECIQMDDGTIVPVEEEL